MPKNLSRKIVETLKHEQASRKNIPSAEHEDVMADDDRSPVVVAYERRNRDLDPQLVWRGKDVEHWSSIVVQSPPLFIQEKVHPKVLIDDLIRRSRHAEKESNATGSGVQADLFSDFNGLPSDEARTEFYQHDANWSNRLILGDSLRVMASLTEREGLRGKVQCIYIDPPYGIKFNSNFQWSTSSRDVRDGDARHITREPEQVKAFRDTWQDGIHSYLTYLRDRLTVARDLLTASGSIFVQIGDEHVHRVRAIMDEVFADECFVSEIIFSKTTGFSGSSLSNVSDHILWYAKSKNEFKYRALWKLKNAGEEGASSYRAVDSYGALNAETHNRERLVALGDLTSQGASTRDEPIIIHGKSFPPKKGMHWKTTTDGIRRLKRSGRIAGENKVPSYVRFLDDFPVFPLSNIWTDTVGQNQFGGSKIYIVQTAIPVVQRCILMTTDPGDLVLDPTCGSGTVAYVAEQWGRRWIMVDTSRVALALVRARMMASRYPYYLLSDSVDGQRKQGVITSKDPCKASTYGDIRHGFVYESVPHITLKSIASNTEIDIIWERFQEVLDPLRSALNRLLNCEWAEWEIPREADERWSDAATEIHSRWWAQRVGRQEEIDTLIATRADFEYLYDKPYEDNRRVRVAGPFTVESISPHRALDVGEDDKLIDGIAESRLGYSQKQDFASVVLEHLRTSGIQQSRREDRLRFSSLHPWPGDFVCAEGRYLEGGADAGTERRAGVFVGPEFGTLVRADLVSAAREAADAGFEVLIACAFNYDARASEFRKLGKVPIVRARMNADLHMAGELKNTGKGNLFVIFGEPDIDILQVEGRGREPNQIQVRINGVDVFHPNTGEVRSHGVEGIACWFIDSDYNEESFFVRHAYFLGAGDPYKALKTTLKAEIDQEAWSTLYSALSRPFSRPQSGRIAVKVINHLGDEVMKVFRV